MLEKPRNRALLTQTITLQLLFSNWLFNYSGAGVIWAYPNLLHDFYLPYGLLDLLACSLTPPPEGGQGRMKSIGLLKKSEGNLGHYLILVFRVFLDFSIHAKLASFLLCGL